MRTRLILPFAVLAVGVASRAPAQSSPCIKGMFVEMRGSIDKMSCSTQTGQATARADDCVVQVWKVAAGAFQGVRLDGLALIAIRQPGGSPTSPGGDGTVLLLDSRADSAQRTALAALANRLAGKSLGNVIAECVEDIDVRIGEGCAHGYAWLDSPMIQAQTRPAKRSDARSAEPRWPLAESYYDYPAEPVVCRWQDLGAEWMSSELIRDHETSAFVGGFWIDQPEPEQSGDRVATR